MNFTYSKEEKLKSRKQIQQLFSEGMYLKKYPLRFVYSSASTDAQTLQVGFSVSKRSFKLAVDRIHLKRLMREAYRLNKHLVTSPTKNNYVCMFIFGSSEKVPFEILERKMIRILEDFNQKLLAAEQQ